GGGGPGGGGRGSGRGGFGGGMGMLQGPDFFADRVKDDPKLADLYDPLLDASSDSNNLKLGATPKDSGALRPVRYDEEQQPPPPARPDVFQAEVQAPKRPVRIEPLPELGIIVIRTDNPADAELVLRLIEQIREYGAGAEIEVRFVQMEQGDATVIATVLTALYQRVIVTASGNSPTLAAPRQQVSQG